MSQILKKILNDLGNETKRLGTQGAMELASALFNGHGFVPYGPGQYTPSTVPQKEPNQAPAQPEIERGGREV
jgi:hypothetical protein